jgi:hypothetical protein
MLSAIRQILVARFFAVQLYFRIADVQICTLFGEAIWIALQC